MVSIKVVLGDGEEIVLLPNTDIRTAVGNKLNEETIDALKRVMCCYVKKLRPWYRYDGVITLDMTKDSLRFERTAIHDWRFIGVAAELDELAECGWFEYMESVFTPLDVNIIMIESVKGPNHWIEIRYFHKNRPLPIMTTLRSCEDGEEATIKWPSGNIDKETGRLETHCLIVEYGMIAVIVPIIISSFQRMREHHMGPMKAKLIASADQLGLTLDANETLEQVVDLIHAHVTLSPGSDAVKDLNERFNNTKFI